MKLQLCRNTNVLSLFLLFKCQKMVSPLRDEAEASSFFVSLFLLSVWLFQALILTFSVPGRGGGGLSNTEPHISLSFSLSSFHSGVFSGRQTNQD